MKVGVGADHGGFEMKQQLAAMLATAGHEVVDLATRHTTPKMTTLILRSRSPVRWQRVMWSVASWCAAAA